MRTFFWVVLTSSQVLLLIALSLKLEKYELTPFKLKQELQQHAGGENKTWRKFYKLLPDLKTLMLVKIVILFAVSVTIFNFLTSPIIGVVYALASLLFIKVLSRLSFLQKYSNKLLEANLSLVVRIVEILSPASYVIGTEDTSVSSLGSYEEFIDQIKHLPSTVLDPWQKQRLEALTAAEQKNVQQIMTLKKRIKMVSSSATLGPVLLSDLQKSGHAYFPVSNKKGEIEGILRLNDIADINQAKLHNKAGDLMSSELAWVSEDTSLIDLVQIFLKAKQHLLLVKNQDEEFIGIVTISDLMKHLLAITQE